MATNKKLGKGLSSLLGNKMEIQTNIAENKGLLLIPIEKIYIEMKHNQERYLIKLK